MPTRWARGRYDAVVVGSGPNGFAAAITLARVGRSVLLVEAAPTLGGGMRSAELTLPGFIHDVCSAIHPLAVASAFFRDLPLADHGLRWIFPPAQVAHPFDDGTAALLERSVEATGTTLGEDGPAYAKLMAPLLRLPGALLDDLLAPLRLPRHPLRMAAFGLRAVWPAGRLARSRFHGERARALFAGLAAHAILPLDLPFTAAVGLVLAITGHAVGWPVAAGGSGQIAAALESYFRSLGGEVLTGFDVDSLNQLPKTRSVFFDVGPRQMVKIAGGRLPEFYRKAVDQYRYGPGAFKLDWALSGPIPWKAVECARAGTVHLGPTLAEIESSERDAWEGRHNERPYVLVAQQSLFDPTRAPAGRHTGWGYCHVPHGSTRARTEAIEAQVERFAPGFRDLILARHVSSPAGLERYNANYVGGDINGGAQDFRQLFTRPVARLVPYATPCKGIYLCSSSTPPGGGVHGMCGYFAAKVAMREGF